MEAPPSILETLLFQQEKQNLIHNALIRHLESGFHFGPHCHQNIELCLMQEGQCDIIVSGETISVHKNEFMALFPNVIHSFHVKDGNSCQFLQLHFRLDNFLNFNPKMYKDLRFLYYLATETKQYLKAPLGDRLLSCVERISFELNHEELNNLAIANLYIYELIFLLSREIQQSFHEVLNIENPHTFAAIRYINENIDRKITLDDVAWECCISKRYLIRIFKECVETTVNNYIILTKINKAMEYIQENNSTLTEIACRLGFSSIQYFSSTFKKYTGVSPREFCHLHSSES